MLGKSKEIQDKLMLLVQDIVLIKNNCNHHVLKNASINVLQILQTIRGKNC